MKEASMTNPVLNRRPGPVAAAILAASLALFALSLSACSGSPAAQGAANGATSGMAGAAGTPGAVRTAPASGPRLELHLVPGKAYSARMGSWPFSYVVQPQVAAWLTTSDGTFVEPLLVTARAAEGSWRMAPAVGRPEALPVFSHLEATAADGVSAATSKGETLHDAGLGAGLPAGRYLVWLEVNRSYDYNAAYPKAGEGVNGQPSVVYRAELDLGGGAVTEARFTAVGTGSPDGSDGEVREGLAGIDSALELFSSLSVSYLPR
jgi:hypothetical protein